MKNLDKFNPPTSEDIEKREEFENLSAEDKRKEINKLHDLALHENTESFRTLIEKMDSEEEKEEIKLALKVCETVGNNGGIALVVGGFARDMALNKFDYNLKPKDIDIEIYGLNFEKLQEILKSLGEINVVGSAFGVVKLKSLDISIPRRDSKTGRGHKGFKIEGDPEMLIKEAAKRRDFTINALALDPLTGEIFDFYGGVEDIKKKMLRATDKNTFVEDPLRVLRAMQFGARFGFEIDEETKELCKTLDLTELSKERIGEEWLKLLMKAPKPSIGLELARELGVLDQLHPEIKALIGVPQNPEYHPEGDVWNHTKLVIDAASTIAGQENLGEDDKKVLMLSALCHDLGKPATTNKSEDGKITSYGHEDAGLEPAKKFLSLINLDKNTESKVLALIERHMFIHSNPDPSDSAIRRLAKKLYPATIKDLVYLSKADTIGALRLAGEYEAGKNLLKKSQELDVQSSKPRPLLMGRDLLSIGYSPGKQMGDILKEIEELQLNGDITDYDGAVEYARKKLAETK